MTGPDETCEVTTGIEGEVCGHPLPCPTHDAHLQVRDGERFTIRAEHDGEKIENQKIEMHWPKGVGKDGVAVTSDEPHGQNDVKPWRTPELQHIEVEAFTAQWCGLHPERAAAHIRQLRTGLQTIRQRCMRTNYRMGTDISALVDSTLQEATPDDAA